MELRSIVHGQNGPPKHGVIGHCRGSANSLSAACAHERQLAVLPEDEAYLTLFDGARRVAAIVTARRAGFSCRRHHAEARGTPTSAAVRDSAHQRRARPLHLLLAQLTGQIFGLADRERYDGQRGILGATAGELAAVGNK